MKEASVVPYLPDSAPFTPEQRAYLNGFLAGMFSRIPAAASQPAALPLEPLLILFGSQTGNAEGLAKRAAKEAGKRGFAPTIHDLANYPMAQLASERCVLVITSTYGDGDPPDNAKAFWEFLSSDAAPKLSQTRFAVLALGDSSYPKFCAFGKAVDARLEALGAQRASSRVDCDVDYEEPFQKWLNETLREIDQGRADVSPVVAGGSTPPCVEITEQALSRGVEAVAEARRDAAEASVAFGRTNPFLAPLVANHKLNGEGSGKDTRHFEFALDGSGFNYEAGDALGVRPCNCPALVEELIGVLGYCGDEPVPLAAGESTSVRAALLSHYEITRIPQPILTAVAERSRDERLLKLTQPGVNGELTRFLRGREIVDLLLAHPKVKFAPEEFVALLKKLQPRLYSISSSPKAHPGQVHLTVSIVRYESLGRKRKGVCSTFLAERVAPDSSVPVFVHPNKNFRPPANNATPIIMIGPGTGIAPFRAFLEERRVRGATGKSWLFFGDQHAQSDFLYREELEMMQRDGTLTRFDTAFSRDQAEKIYVQQRMLENAPELFDWLESGAHFYVCGDANRMAKDVDQALHEVIANAGGRTHEEASEYIRRLQNERRYQRDVY